MTLQGKRFRVFASSLPGKTTDQAPGTPLHLTKNGLEMACGGGSVLEIRTLQADGRQAHGGAGLFPGPPARVIMGARQTALGALIACRKQGAWSDGALKEYAARDRLDRREAALAARLCYGVLQNRMLLDFWLGGLSGAACRSCSRWCWTSCGWACIRLFFWIKSRIPPQWINRWSWANNMPTPMRRDSSTAYCVRRCGRRIACRSRRSWRCAIPTPGPWWSCSAGKWGRKRCRRCCRPTTARRRRWCR